MRYYTAQIDANTLRVTGISDTHGPLTAPPEKIFVEITASKYDELNAMQTAGTALSYDPETGEFEVADDE